MAGTLGGSSQVTYVTKSDREMPSPVEALAEAAKIPLAGHPQPCEECERITLHVEL